MRNPDKTIQLANDIRKYYWFNETKFRWRTFKFEKGWKLCILNPHANVDNLYTYFWYWGDPPANI